MPSIRVRPVGSARAIGLGRKPSSAATAVMRASVAAFSRPGRPSARDTVEGLTPAARATS